MSAWAQAAYIIKQIETQLGLTDRVVRLENRLYVFAQPKSTSIWEPDLTGTYTFSEDSVWFVESDEQDENNNYKVYAMSVYQTINNVSGWSDPIYFTANADQVIFEPSDSEGILASITNVEDALNTLAANTSGGTADALKSETASVSNWSVSPVTTYSDDSTAYYYATITLQDTYGDHPTISLVASGTNKLPTQAQINAFNNIDYILVDNNQLTFLSKKEITTSFTVCVKL